MTMIIDGTNGLTFPDTSKQYNSYYSFKNRIINGGMVIDQRNAGASVSTGASATFFTDRWEFLGSPTSKFTGQQSSTAPAGFINSLLLTSTSAYSVAAGDFIRLAQRIEGLNVADLGWGTANAQTVTLSFQVRSSLTGTFGGYVTNNAQNRTYPFTFTISAANTFETKTVTIPGDTSGTWLTTNGTGIELGFQIGVGSTYLGTAGAWAGANYYGATGGTNLVATNGATFYITGVQLEKGSTATSFDYRPYGTELALCQRYYYRLYGPNNYVGNGFSYATTSSYARVQFPVTMRAAPSALEQSGTASHYVVLYNATQITCTSVPSFENATVNAAMSTFTASGGPATGTSTLPQINSASGYLGWSAEL